MFPPLSKIFLVILLFCCVCSLLRFVCFLPLPFFFVWHPLSQGFPPPHFSTGHFFYLRLLSPKMIFFCNHTPARRPTDTRRTAKVAGWFWATFAMRPWAHWRGGCGEKAQIPKSRCLVLLACLLMVELGLIVSGPRLPVSTWCLHGVGGFGAKGLSCLLT